MNAVTNRHPQMHEAFIWVILIAALIFVITHCGCTKPETAQPFPLDIEPIEGTQLFTIYRSEPIDVVFTNYWTDATYLLNFRCYDEARNQEWCVVGFGTLCVQDQCKTLE